MLAVLLVLCLVFGTTAHSQLPSFSVSSSTPSSPFRCLSSTCSFITLPHFLSLYFITSSISPPLPSPLLSFSFPHAPPRLVPGIDPCPRPPPIASPYPVSPIIGYPRIARVNREALSCPQRLLTNRSSSPFCPSSRRLSTDFHALSPTLLQLAHALSFPGSIPLTSFAGDSDYIYPCQNLVDG